ncbi:hypothetical protein ACRQ1B_16535 [Rhizobium panacihumi]|uniref:hypothetical protein n=1 Tax=Rhizobium panacihumi TaxID=2008450 RepID=UPI003D7BBD05
MIKLSFWIWLAILAIPVFSLVAAQWDINNGPSIGGGGYDLGPFIYSWLLIIITFIWSLCVLGVAIVRRSRTSQLTNFGLPAIGAITFAILFLVYQNNLF